MNLVATITRSVNRTVILLCSLFAILVSSVTHSIEVTQSLDLLNNMVRTILNRAISISNKLSNQLSINQSLFVKRALLTSSAVCLFTSYSYNISSDQSTNQSTDGLPARMPTVFVSHGGGEMTKHNYSCDHLQLFDDSHID